MAGDMLSQLTDGLVADERIERVNGTVTHASWDKQTALWSVTVGQETATRSAPILVYCTGAHPTTVTLPSSVPQDLDLDTALAPSVLSQILPANEPIVVGVIGASHSAVLVLMNLITLAQSTHPNLRVRWFTRHQTLKFAKYLDDGSIMFDNTGLKGNAAKFAREQLDGDRLATSEAGKIVNRIYCAGGVHVEQTVFKRDLPSCRYVVQAVGYTKNLLPRMSTGADDSTLHVTFDHETGGFVDGVTGQGVNGLFGAGISFPQKVIDKSGSIEYAVGFWKFMRFLKEVVPQWVQRSRTV